MACDKCESKRVASVGGKTSDMCSVSIDGTLHDGYVPRDMNIGGGDYLDFELCFDCGKVQGKFPLPMTKLENPEEEEAD